MVIQSGDQTATGAQDIHGVQKTGSRCHEIPTRYSSLDVTPEDVNGHSSVDRSEM